MYSFVDPSGSLCGKGMGDIWMDNVVCSGNEKALWKCKFNGWGTHNCDHVGDVGVECNPPIKG